MTNLLLDSYLSLALRTAHAGSGTHYGHRGDLLLSYGQTVLEGSRTLLAASLWCELRHGRGYRHHPGVRVRYQLEQLFVDGRRHLWRTARHRGHRSLLYGEHLRGRNVLWLEQSLTRLPPCFDMAHRLGCHHLGLVDSCRQRLDAISHRSGVQPRHHALRDDLVCRRGSLALRRG